MSADVGVLLHIIESKSCIGMGIIRTESSWSAIEFRTLDKVRREMEGVSGGQR